jgi:hypothetical protein
MLLRIDPNNMSPTLNSSNVEPRVFKLIQAQPSITIQTLKLLLSDLIEEIFVLDEKGELPQKFPTIWFWSGLIYIGTMIFPKWSIDCLWLSFIWSPGQYRLQ